MRASAFVAVLALAFAIATGTGTALARPAQGVETAADASAVRIAADRLASLSIPRAAASAGEARKLWVFFTDKALSEADERAAIDQAAASLSPRALARRAKVGMQVNRNDLPVAEEYVSAVSATGAEIVVRTRWLNAVSVRATAAQAAAIARLPFVREVRPVARATKELPVITPADSRPGGGGGRSLNYGESYGQLDQIQVTDLHEEGYDGTGILIAMFDTGFDTSHQAFASLDLVAERDFINNDAETADEPGDPEGQDSHGTATLSCVGGAYPGQLYGGSYNASFALAKTEMIDDEIQIEEDHWVAAAEWADSLGADVISSSLGYFDWYTYEDMDGNTAVTTIAADMAAARGIVVVNSMGNEGDSYWVYMIAPADGDSVVSVGAVDLDGVRRYWSSIGPTYDGRTKPDVMALGSYVYVASTGAPDEYGYSSGTSFSCPLTAGAVGLLLEGHSEWAPSDVIEAIHTTATQSGSPDNYMGWGILQAADAMHSAPLGVDETGAGGPALVAASPNPFAPQTAVRYVVREDGRVRVTVHDASGRLVRTVFDGVRRAGSYASDWDGTDGNGENVASGVYFVRLAWDGGEAVSKMALLR